ncbi:MAG TPA: hypothetical protein HPP94_06890 [Desulfuromonadales bacterium]|nr:hypothetical protein [Desulfuromonadales bacterium]
MKKYYFLIFLLFIFGCSMPSTSVMSVDARPSLAIKGASATADLLIDGLNVGKAAVYSGDTKTLTIEPGTHRVTISDNGQVVYEQNIFVESELKTITVR